MLRILPKKPRLWFRSSGRATDCNRFIDRLEAIADRAVTTCLPDDRGIGTRVEYRLVVLQAGCENNAPCPVHFRTNARQEAIFGFLQGVCIA